MTDKRRAGPSAAIEFKALKTKGEFSALVSVFGNVDLGGDRMVYGSFGKSLTDWRAKGDPIPIIWNHMWDDPEAHIGEADPNDVVETKDGLLVERGRIDLDRPFAEQVFHLMERRRVKEFSFGYRPRDAEKAKDGALDLLDVDLFEIGPTLKGMNPETELLAVKALAAVDLGTSPIVVQPIAVPVTYDADSKAGARLSKETRTSLARIRDEIDGLLATDNGDEPSKSDEAKATGKASDLDADLLTQIHLVKEM